MPQFLEDTKLNGVRRLEDGFLHADANVARIGIQTYLGREVGRPELETVKIYRPETEVRDARSLATFSHAPITIGHPKERVTADNWKSLAVGEVSTEAHWVDNKIRLPLILKDSKAIKLVENGTRELSAGYVSQLDWTPGEFEGESYDAIQRDIKINHVAIVPRGRAGSECRIGDADTWGAMPQNGVEKMNLKTIVIGDNAVQVADTDAAHVESLVSRVKAQDADLAKKDGEIATLQTKLNDAEAKLNDTADLDARAEARANLLDTARKLSPKVETKGLSDQAIKEAVVKDRRGETAIKDKSPEYIAAAFDFLVDEAAKQTPPVNQKKTDPVRNALADSKGENKIVSMQDAQADYEKRMQNAWSDSAAG